MEIGTLTMLLPDDTANRLKSMARSLRLSMTKRVEQLSAHALVAWDTESRFRELDAAFDVWQPLAVLVGFDASAEAGSARRASCAGSGFDGRQLHPEPRSGAGQSRLRSFFRPHLVGHEPRHRVRRYRRSDQYWHSISMTERNLLYVQR